MGAGAALSAAHGRLLVLADSAFPTGAFAHSWGLEWAVRRGWVTGTEDLYPWVRDALHFGVAPLEGRVVARAVRLTEQCRKDERALALAFVARAVRLSDDAASFLPSREARRAGGQLGRSLLAAAGAAFPELHSIAGAGLVQAARGHDERPQLPVAWGLTGAVLGIEAVALVQAYLLNTVGSGRRWPCGPSRSGSRLPWTWSAGYSTTPPAWPERWLPTALPWPRSRPVGMWPWPGTGNSMRATFAVDPARPHRGRLAPLYSLSRSLRD